MRATNRAFSNPEVVGSSGAAFGLGNGHGQCIVRAMKQIGGKSNVFFDERSRYPYERLNEREFFTALLSRVSETLEAAGHPFQLYLYSAHQVTALPNQRPESADLPGDRKVLIMISEESMAVPTHLTSSYHTIFKAYLRDDPASAASNVFCLPLGHVNGFPVHAPKPWHERGLRAFFAGNLNRNRAAVYRAFTGARILPLGLVRLLIRAKLAPQLLKLWNTRNLGIPGARIEFTAGFKSGLPIAEYAAQLYDSKILLCPGGFQSPETFRHLEAAAAGAVVITEPLPKTELYAGSPFIEVRDWAEGRQRLLELLQEPEEQLAARGRASREWYDAKLSLEATAARMVKTLLR